MSFVSLYRKWRSQTFDEIAGQVHVTKTIKNAIKYERITHAYLFCGPKGTGKTSTARILARALNCEKGPCSNPCNTCEMCIQISSGSAIDVIEIDGASNRGINEIRDLREKIKYAPTKGRYKVYIVDEVHMLTKEAFNAILKTLEEPPKHVIFVLATTEPHKLLSTILSRCQRFNFRRISINDTINHLKYISKKENLKIEESVLNLIAESSEGSLRDALNSLDQVISFCGRDIKLSDVKIVFGNLSEQVFLELTDCVIKQDGGTILTLARKVIEEGEDITPFIKEFIKYFRDLLILKICPSWEGLIYSASIKEMERQAKIITVPRIMNIIKLLTDLKQQFHLSGEDVIQMEITFLLMCHRAADRSPGVMEERLAEIEEKIKRLSEFNRL
ncbi:MAG: DNA polymerase III subunit gamma/tau [Candidatus Eremiobacterota bacterium]